MEIETILKPGASLPHLAFVRGWINGLDLKELGPRYLAQVGAGALGDDVRTTKAALRMVLKELFFTAQRHEIPGAAVLKRQAERIRLDASMPTLSDLPEQQQHALTRPSFEQYVSSLPHAEDFSTEELVAAYDDLYPAQDLSEVLRHRAEARRERLLKAQLKLINELERKIGAPLSPGDSIAGWFEESLSQRLAASGMQKIADLIRAITANPGDWHKTVPGIGATKAARIERYLSANLGDLNQLQAKIWSKIAADVGPTKPPRTLEIDVIESAGSLTPSLPGRHELDGSQGKLRDRVNESAISAPNDYEAMNTWLSLKKSASTVKLYRREVMRLIAWCIQVRGKSMSSLMVEDALAYRDFMYEVPEMMRRKKGPAKGFKKSAARPSQVTIPGFTKGSLKESSVKKALTIISGFFTWLMDVRYVTANPFAAISADRQIAGVAMGSTEASDEAGLLRSQQRRSTVRERVLPREAIDAVMAYLALPCAPEQEANRARERFVFLMTVTLGLRISEVAAARRADLEYIQPDLSAGFDGGWLLHVLGKRDKPREVPFPDRLVPELEAYLHSRGLIEPGSPALSIQPGTFLVGPLPSFISTKKGAQSKRTKAPADGVRPQVVHNVLKGLFLKSIEWDEFKDPASRSKLKAATAHWLRHTAATHAVAADVPLDIVASNLGHADISTTSIYIHAERKRKMAEMQRLWAATETKGVLR